MRSYLYLAVLFLFTGCAGWTRGCDSWFARSIGANWIVVQYDQLGRPFNCWKLNGVSIANEEASDGIFWVDDHTGNLVHISGWYNRVQVSRFGTFDDAARLIGIDLDRCTDGRYVGAMPQVLAGPAEIHQPDSGRASLLPIVVPPPMGTP